MYNPPSRRKPNRNFVSTLQLILSPKLKQLQQEKPPEIVLGQITPHMRALQRRIRQGRKIVESAEKALARLHVSVGHSCGCALPDLRVAYEREREIKARWIKQRNARLDKLEAIKREAMVDLLDMESASAQKYLRRVSVAIDRL